MTMKTGRLLAIDEGIYRAWCADVARATITAEQLHSPEAATRLLPARRSVGQVAVVSLSGYLTQKPNIFSFLFGGTSVQAFAREIVSALGDQSVGAVVMDVDSPGGEVHGMTEAAQIIRAARGMKPLLAAVNPFATSAAYWLAAQADEIAITPSGLTGSVGCFTYHVDESGALDQAGLKVTLVRHGARKNETNAAEPLAEAARAALQARVDYFGELFENDIARGRSSKARKVSAEAVRSTYGEGAVMTAPEALAAGMVDRVATIDEVLQRAADGYKPAGAAPRAYDPAEAKLRAALAGIDIEA